MLWSNKLRAVKRIIYAKGQKVIIFFNRVDPKIFKDKKKRSVSGAISSHMDSFSGSLANPLEDIGRIVKSGSAKIYGPYVANGHGKPVPAFSSERFNRGKAGTPLRTYLSTSDNEELKMNSVAASVAMKEAIERERERATKEARERAAAERAAVERAEKHAVQKVQAAVLKRAATAAKERAETAAAEARERENAEARAREAQERAAKARVEAGKAFVQNVIEEARARAAVEALNRAAAAAAAAASVNQQNMGARASSAPRPRANFKDPMFNTQSQNMQGPEVARTSSGTASTMRKASSSKNIDNDFTSVFGDMEGASERRQRSRLERKNCIEERVAKALAEKNQRDLQIQNEQAERNRIAEKLDVKIGHWSSGKKGDIRALLSTLQHILGPDCGWQQVSLTDLKSNESVKKMFKKSALCVHPDKVQQRGANLEQKYISEKVFDLLKKAWEKFNSTEHI